MVGEWTKLSTRSSAPEGSGEERGVAEEGSLIRMCTPSRMERREAVLSEWLRRLTRNQLGSARVGSNPADCDDLFCFF